MTKTRKCLHSALAAVVMLCLAGVWQRGQAQDKPAEKAPEKAPAGRTLKVKLKYTGPGTVDEKHKIFVFVFDTPDFVHRSGSSVLQLHLEKYTGPGTVDEKHKIFVFVFDTPDFVRRED